MLCHLNIFWRNPAELGSNLHAFLFMHHTIVQDIRHLHLVALGRVLVQNDAPTLKPLLGKRLPFHLSHSTWAWSSDLASWWLESVKYQSRWLASLNDATPLLPVYLLPDDLSIKSSFIRLNVRPLLRLAEANVLLLVENPRGAELVEALLHILDGLVIDMKEAVDSRVRNMVQEQQEHGSLCGQRCATRASSFHKDGVSMMGIDTLHALPKVASMLLDTSVGLQLPQGSTLTMWTKNTFPSR